MNDPTPCPSCAAEVPAGARFCVRCGTEIDLGEGAPADTPTAGASSGAPAAGSEPSSAPTDLTPPAPDGPGGAPTAGGTTTEIPGGAPVAPGADAPTQPAGSQMAGPAEAPTQPLTPAGGFVAPGAPSAPGAPAGPPTASGPGFGGPAHPEGPTGLGAPVYPAAPPVAGPSVAPPTTFAPPPPAPVPQPAAPRSGRNVAAGLVGLLSAVAFGVASFLPWADIDRYRGIEGAVVTGWDGLTSGIQDGPFFAAVAVVAAFLAGSLLAGRCSLGQKLLLLLSGAVAFGLAVYELAEYWTDVDDINAFGGSASVGAGLWIAAFAGIGILLAALLSTRTTKAPRAEAPADPAATLDPPRAVGAVG